MLNKLRVKIVVRELYYRRMGGISVKGSNSDFKSIDSQFYYRAQSKTHSQMCFCTCFDLPELRLHMV